MRISRPFPVGALTVDDLVNIKGTKEIELYFVFDGTSNTIYYDKFTTPFRLSSNTNEGLVDFSGKFVTSKHPNKQTFMGYFHAYAYVLKRNAAIGVKHTGRPKLQKIK